MWHEDEKSNEIEIDTTLLPPLLKSFVRIIGIKATLDFVEAYGGLRIYVPAPENCTPDHPYSKIIGIDNLVKLAGVYGREAHFQLPKGTHALLAARNNAISAAYSTQKTARELALQYKLTETQIGRIIARLGAKPPKDRRQATLF